MLHLLPAKPSDSLLVSATHSPASTSVLHSCTHPKHQLHPLTSPGTPGSGQDDPQLWPWTKERHSELEMHTWVLPFFQEPDQGRRTHMGALTWIFRLQGCSHLLHPPALIRATITLCCKPSLHSWSCQDSFYQVEYFPYIFMVFLLISPQRRSSWPSNQSLPTQPLIAITYISCLATLRPVRGGAAWIPQDTLFFFKELCRSLCACTLTLIQ